MIVHVHLNLIVFVHLNSICFFLINFFCSIFFNAAMIVYHHSIFCLEWKKYILRIIKYSVKNKIKQKKSINDKPVPKTFDDDELLLHFSHLIGFNFFSSFTSTAVIALLRSYDINCTQFLLFICSFFFLFVLLLFIIFERKIDWFWYVSNRQCYLNCAWFSSRTTKQKVAKRKQRKEIYFIIYYVLWLSIIRL